MDVRDDTGRVCENTNLFQLNKLSLNLDKTNYMVSERKLFKLKLQVITQVAILPRNRLSQSEGQIVMSLGGKEQQMSYFCVSEGGICKKV